MLDHIKTIHDILFHDDGRVPTDGEKQAKLADAKQMLKNRIPCLALTCIPGHHIIQHHSPSTSARMCLTTVSRCSSRRSSPSSSTSRSVPPHDARHVTRPQLVYRLFDRLMDEMFPEKE